MRISALEEYGLRCLLALSQAGVKGQLSISEIAAREGLSVPYASKLLSILRRAGLVEAIRGRHGGFRITRPAESINLLEVITTLGGPLIEPMHCTKYSGRLEKCVHLGNCSVFYVLSGLAGYIGDYLSEMTLADILNGNTIARIRQIESKVRIANSDIPIKESYNTYVENVKPSRIQEKH